MFLRNFDNYLMGLCGIAHPKYTTSSGGSTGEVSNHGELGNVGTNYGKYLGQDTVFQDGQLSYKASNGTITKLCYLVRKSSAVYTVLALAKNTICLGTGTTPVTYEDFTLSGDIVDNNNLVYVSGSITYDAERAVYQRSARYTLTNTGENPIIINEWGLFNQCVGDSTPKTIFTINSNTYLMYRELLPETITIAPGETTTLTFKIDIPVFHHPNRA